MKEERIPCPECGAYSGHSPTCSLAPVEYRAAQMSRFYEAWLRDTSELKQWLRQAQERAVMWQGKYAMLKHENNILRRKLYQKTVADKE